MHNGAFACLMLMADTRDFARASLLRLQRDDGSWSYGSKGIGYPEPTCLALLALPADEWTARQRGMQWLMRRINDAGAMALEDDSEPHWATALALFVFTELGVANELRTRCAQRLLSWEGIRVEPDPAIPLDPGLRGWPWTSGAFSWVEPTAYALLALKRAGYADHPRVAEGERLLLDRICTGGGWNYGNREVLGQTLAPMAHTTAWALLSLQGAAGAEDAVEQGLTVLEREIDRYPSALSLSLAILAFEIWGRPLELWAERLRQRQGADGSWRQQTHLTALSLLALRAATGGGNAFRL